MLCGCWEVAWKEKTSLVVWRSIVGNSHSALLWACQKPPGVARVLLAEGNPRKLLHVETNLQGQDAECLVFPVLPKAPGLPPSLKGEKITELVVL